VKVAAVVTDGCVAHQYSPSFDGYHLIHNRAPEKVMDFVTVRELRTETPKVWEKLEAGEQAGEGVAGHGSIHPLSGIRAGEHGTRHR
jgi:hypothetical protein